MTIFTLNFWQYEYQEGSYFKFSKSQRLGILFLLTVIVVCQLAYFVINVDSIEESS
jgi:hypothetical protein